MSSRPANNAPLGGPWATVLFAAGCAVVSPVFSELSSIIEYDRSRVVSGELWRLWTSSFTHFSGSHLFWNLVLLVGIGGWLERRRPWSVRGLYLLAPLAIGAVLRFSASSPEVYRGFSGVASGFVALAACHVFRSGSRALGLAIGFLLGLKITIELWLQPAAMLVDYHNATVVTWPTAHLIGAGCGVLMDQCRAAFARELSGRLPRL